jgi:integrase
MVIAVKVAGGYGLDAIRLAALATSYNTQRTYEAPIWGYQTHCIENGISPAAIDLTPQTGANYIARLGAEGRLSSGTIRVYRSALSSWWLQSTFSNGDNPMLSTAVSLVLRGIALSRVELDRANRLRRPRAVEITVELLQEIGAKGANADDTRSVMMWAAANVALYGFLRPGELLGSYANPARRLRAEQITFSTEPVPESGQRAPGVSLPPRLRVDRFTIDLGVTKADPLGRNEPKVVAAKPAVDALWLWMSLREGLSPQPNSALFAIPGERPLTMKVLLIWLADWYCVGGRARPHFTGKGFRRGAASSALASGARRADIAVQGRWKSERMVEVYASKKAKKDREVAFSRRMATPRRA